MGRCAVTHVPAHAAEPDEPEAATDPLAGMMKQVPTLHQVWETLVFGFYVFIVTFLAGLGLGGIDSDHISNLKRAVEAAVVAMLAALGVGVSKVATRPNSKPTIF